MEKRIDFGECFLSSSTRETALFPVSTISSTIKTSYIFLILNLKCGKKNQKQNQNQKQNKNKKITFPFKASESNPIIWTSPEDWSPI